jgi:hypothetical protein
VHAFAELPAGKQVLKIVADTQGWNLNYFTAVVSTSDGGVADGADAAVTVDGAALPDGPAVDLALSDASAQ